MFVSITRLRVRSLRFFPLFIWESLRSARQARSADGNVVVDLLKDSDRTYWTRSLWRDEAAMRGFMMTGPHRRVMPKLLEWCDEATVVHWEQDGSETPTWAEAHRRMVAQGRPSKLRHPSEAHEAFTVRPPKASAG